MAKKATKPAGKRVRASSVRAGGKIPAAARRRKTTSPQRKPAGEKKGRRPRRVPIRRVLSGVGIILLGLALWILWPYLTAPSNPEFGASLPKGYGRVGIDISRYQKEIQWDSLRVMTDARGRTTRSLLKATRVLTPSFVCIKATEGTSLKDKCFDSYWTEARAHSLPRCAYHFFRSSKDAAAQAAHFISTVGALSPGDMPPVLDVETLHRGCTRKQLNAGILTWLRAVEKHYGVKPVVYCPDSFACDLLDKAITGHYPIWVAHYRVDRPKWKDWKYWQFTDAAVIHGIPGLADLSVLAD